MLLCPWITHWPIPPFILPKDNSWVEPPGRYHRPSKVNWQFQIGSGKSQEPIVPANCAPPMAYRHTYASKWMISNVLIQIQIQQACFRLPQSLLQVSTKRDTRPFSNGTPPSHLRTNWFGIKWRMWSRLRQTASSTFGYNVQSYTHTSFLCKFRLISRMTSGTIKKPEFQQKSEDSHVWDMYIYLPG